MKHEVDVLGTGAIMFSSAALQFDVRAWPRVNMVDLSLAIEAARARLPLVCLSRRRDFIRVLEQGQADSIFIAMQRNGLGAIRSMGYGQMKILEFGRV